MATKKQIDSILGRAWRQLEGDRLAFLDGQTIGMSGKVADLEPRFRREYHRIATLAADVKALRHALK